MAEFGKWIKTEPHCEMPEESDEVLILLHDRGYKESPCDVYEVDLGTYNKHLPYIWSLFPELGGFDTVNDWIEGNKIEVVAWMPKPPAKLEE